jgi:hypothetical protein
MKDLRVAAAVCGLALLTFFQFPGHTWLQQDTQIYAPILEHLSDPAVLRNDPVAQHPHVAFTLYDEAARVLRRATGLSFREVLEAQQIATRGLGIWGLYLLATAMGLSLWPALAATALVSLGAYIAGPSVLTFEYEPTPRAFAVPLLFCAMGLAAHRRWMAASVVGAAAFLYHPPTTLPFWAVFGPMLLWRRRWRELAVPVSAALLLAAAARLQGDANMPWFARLTPLDEQLQRLRTAYVWISLWPASQIVQELALALIAAGAFLRIRSKSASEALLLIGALAGIGLLSMPLSWLLLERMHWSLLPQIQPLRALLFVALAAQLFSAVAALRASSRLEAFGWFAAAFLIPVQPWPLRAVAVAVALAGLCAFTRLAVLAAFFLLPIAGGVVNYPRLHTREVAELSSWASRSTPPDAVFLFADAPRSLAPGIFRAESLRAIYVDWKSGGQVNYLSDFARQWWFRWQQTLARGFQPGDLPRYSGLGIQYVVIRPENRLSFVPVFANSAYLVYRLQ